MTWLITYHAEEISREGFRGFNPPNKYIGMEYSPEHPFDWLAEKQAFYKQCLTLEVDRNTIVIATRVLGIISAIEGPNLEPGARAE